MRSVLAVMFTLRLVTSAATFATAADSPVAADVRRQSSPVGSPASPRLVTSSPTTNAASFDRLMVRLQSYGSTALKRRQKEEAKAELFRRGGASLRYLVARAHIRNMWFHVYAEKLVKEGDKDEAVPVLVDLLDSERR